MWRKSLSTLLVLAGGLALVGLTQARIDAVRSQTLKHELLYIPSKSILQHLTAGMSNVVADLLWIETIQYTVGEFHSAKAKFQWLESMLHAVVDLDPYFEGVYVNGGAFLSAVGEDEKAIRLLKKGFVRNPDSADIPHEIVKAYVLNRREQPGAAVAATHYLRMVAERHQYPQLYLNWARHIQEQNDLAGSSVAIWEDVIANAEDPFVREVAETNLRVLLANREIEPLQELVDRFAATYGDPPESLDALVDAGWIPALPDPERFGEFFIDENGTLHSVAVLDDRKSRLLMYLNARIRVASDKRGETPPSIEQIPEWTDVPMPDHPYPGELWQYDPETGTVS